MFKKLVKNKFNSYTQESCYFAGLLAADGNLDINGTIGLELKNSDKLLIEKFKEFTESEHILSITEKSCRIRFSSIEIKDSLQYNFNVCSNKTFNMELPLFPNIENYQDFIRGFFDGDGCLTEFFNSRHTASYRVYLTSGSLLFLEQLLHFLQDEKICAGGSIHKKAANCWHIQLGIKDSTTFLNFIYKNNSTNLFLPRKYELYTKLVVNNNRTKR